MSATNLLLHPWDLSVNTLWRHHGVHGIGWLVAHVSISHHLLRSSCWILRLIHLHLLSRHQFLLLLELWVSVHFLTINPIRIPSDWLIHLIANFLLLHVITSIHLLTETCILLIVQLPWYLTSWLSAALRQVEILALTLNWPTNLTSIRIVLLHVSLLLLFWV